ncbi:MAG: M23 family metallopeptidase [Gammaproteobacteria bacterium]|nr:M23 family metallopeptidase [Rhodocyclaceae bacterium]MBU3910408.1 M23 family metallopeptidase [Gammaproteobacteria bacterium]MBU3990129.1 M23 family metallopeptidase [Gammaproteobacteria bacterium]MBU4004889.1 M23 family metallopeptidase [Gammaproteobacteria bacterium]MBU4020482.1 M23 family metallopeptidase [Gammaproteobacteria bacterium]
MHIILVSNRMATARSISLTGGHLAFIAGGLIAAILSLSFMFSYLTVRHAAEIRMPALRELLRTVSLEEAGKTHDLVRESLANMASRLGQMQGQLLQLDSLGERIAGLAGVKSNDGKAAQTAKAGADGRGGPLTRPDNLTQDGLQRALDEMSYQVDVRSDSLAILESRLFEERIRKNLLPTALPVPTAVPTSNFGWRPDPFTNQAAMHEGIDFIAEPGTPILAAAAGIVQVAERHPQYGNMIDIDHGNNLVTRYAHAQQIFVKPGEFIKRGQRIATVGSTGRSTGPHLHFEVRVGGAAQNPMRFLAREGSQLAQRQ